VRPEAGERVVVRTPDRREYRGQLLEVREQDRGPYALVRLDSGWETTYPLHMVHPEREKASD
jgi:hypothetical protein